MITIKAANEWVADGRRSIKIEISNLRKEIISNVWCCDYDAEYGIWVDGGDKLPTTKELVDMRINGDVK